ncbi:hypothetical protein QR46_2156 [Giardia duodenalis assemblage B]|uniref:Uncharacterized protein n=1 Tax=Giardia duodenalis assemblage B TaxID=1394984 RepID=A0A132NUZ2_GIAIN|nr:hypothetical protein QR46_2156 [Giardia intestinalis assemblage B]
MGLPQRQHRDADLGTCPWRGRPCRRSRHTSTASSRARTSYPTGATYCLPMRGLRQTGAAVKERHGSSWTARHDTIVCACSACRGAQRGAGGQTHSHLHDQNQKPDTWPSTSAGP